MMSTSLPVSIGIRKTPGYRRPEYDIELVLIFSLLLSDVEIRALTINPYQVLQSHAWALCILAVVTGMLSP